jgi:nitric oxide reductase subunit B
MKENTLPSAERRAQMAGFFFWTAWAAATERPADVGGTAPPTPTTGRTSR